ncbi:MAG: AI-2E family transporter [Gammaproteobacteria bacterium]|nr:AI-2E family transporter [Gammaproteobacteria bacterium]
MLAAFVVVVAGIKAAEELMVPFLLAAFLATIAATPVFWMARHRIPAGAAIAVVVVALIAVLVGVGAVVASSVDDFREQMPFYGERLNTLVAGGAALALRLGFDLSEVSALDGLDPSQAFTLAGNMLAGFGNVLSNGFLILLTVIFILGEASSFPAKLKAVLKVPERDLPHFRRFADNVNRYIAIKTAISAATGVVIWVAMWIIGVDFPALWGLLAFLLNYVPTIGSLIAAAPPVLLALVQLGAWHAAAVAAVFAVTNVGFGNVVEPRFMGRGLGLSTLVVFLSLVFWGWMLGPVGMLLSVPLTMTLKIALEANPGTTWLALLLGPATAAARDAPPDEAAP